MSTTAMVRIILSTPDFKECDDDNCAGLFVCGETSRIQACDTCKRFDNDDDAIKWLDHILHLIPSMARSLP